MSYFSGTGAATRPLRIPAILADLPFTFSVFQSQGPIVDRNRLVSVFLRDPISTFTPSPNRVRTLCMLPAMNGGKVILPRALYSRFGETVRRVPDVDWLFALDETDPWVKTYVVLHNTYTTVCLAVYSFSHSWQANSNVVRYPPPPRRKMDDRSGSLTILRYFTRLTSSKQCQNRWTRNLSP